MHTELAEEKERGCRLAATNEELRREATKLMGMVSERTRDQEELALQLKKVLDERNENGAHQENLFRQNEAEMEKKLERLRKEVFF